MVVCDVVQCPVIVVHELRLIQLVDFIGIQSGDRGEFEHTGLVGGRGCVGLGFGSRRFLVGVRVARGHHAEPVPIRFGIERDVDHVCLVQRYRDGSGLATDREWRWDGSVPTGRNNQLFGCAEQHQCIGGAGRVVFVLDVVLEPTMDRCPSPERAGSVVHRCVRVGIERGGLECQWPELGRDRYRQPVFDVE
jgi:hypothetical protein